MFENIAQGLRTNNNELAAAQDYRCRESSVLNKPDVTSALPKRVDGRFDDEELNFGGSKSDNKQRKRTNGIRRSIRSHLSFAKWGLREWRCWPINVHTIEIFSEYQLKFKTKYLLILDCNWMTKADKEQRFKKMKHRPRQKVIESAFNQPSTILQEGKPIWIRSSNTYVQIQKKKKQQPNGRFRKPN